MPRNVMGQLAHASGVLLIVMGLMMADRGLNGYDFGTLLSAWRHCGMAEHAEPPGR